MREFAGKVAVVTGAASGIGRALARQCALEGMKVVLADVERAALADSRRELLAAGAEVHAVFVDVSRIEEVERLAERTLERFGSVHLLFNNAGVGLVGPCLWETTSTDWEWILGVNLRGVVYGLMVFIPIMREQDTECHVVNTASAAGLVAPPGMGPYVASKAAVIAVSEALHHELARARTKVKVSVLCPGLVRSALLDAERNRPTALRNAAAEEQARRERHAEAERELRAAMAAAMSPREVASQVLRAVREERFLVFTHPWVTEALSGRVRNTLAGRAPWDDGAEEEPEP